MPASIRHHFELRRDSERRLLRGMWRRGRMALLIGIAFLAVCLFARSLLLASSSTAAHIVAEGLLIVGWVAMWGPLDIFLYGWWPIYGRCKLFDRLARLEVEMRPCDDLQMSCGPFISTRPITITAAAATRRAPKGSPSSRVPIRAPNSTEVSRRAATCAIGPSTKA